MPQLWNKCLIKGNYVAQGYKMLKNPPSLTISQGTIPKREIIMKWCFTKYKDEWTKYFGMLDVDSDINDNTYGYTSMFETLPLDKSVTPVSKDTSDTKDTIGKKDTSDTKDAIGTSGITLPNKITTFGWQPTIGIPKMNKRFLHMYTKEWSKQPHMFVENKHTPQVRYIYMSRTQEIIDISDIEDVIQLEKKGYLFLHLYLKILITFIFTE